MPKHYEFIERLRAIAGLSEPRMTGEVMTKQRKKPLKIGFDLTEPKVKSKAIISDKLKDEEKRKKMK